MRTRIIFALMAAIALAGCAGGGGSTVPGPGSGGGGSNMTSQEAVQSGADSALSTIESGDLANPLFSGSTGVTLFSSSVKPMAAPMTSGTCNNGVIFTKTIISPTQTQYEWQYFYDLGCTQLRRDVVSLVTQTGTSSFTIARTAKDYNNSGLLMTTRTVNYAVTGSVGNFSAVATGQLVVGTSSSPAALFGHQLTVAPQSSTVSTIAGNSARVENVVIPSINESFGSDALLQNVTATLDPTTGNITYAGARNSAFFKGALGSLTIPSAPPFVVNGGTQIGTATVNGSIVFNSMDELLSVALNVTLVNGDTVVVTSTGSGATISINGVISSPSGTQLATFSVDRFGNGIITYANGSQAIILDWHVVH